MSIVNVNSKNIDGLISSGGVVLVDVWSESCAPCVAFGKTLPSIDAECPSVQFLKLDIGDGDNRAYAISKGVRGIPAIFVYKDGTLVDSWTGFKNKDFVIDKLKKI